MQGEEIIIQLQKFLPKFTDKFSTNTVIASITSAGLTATVTTATVHGLSPGNVVNIVDTQSPVNITSISRSGIIATVTTSDDHDLTEGAFATVTLAGTSEAIFNGTFKFLTTVNRRTFTFQVADSGATSATGGQLTDPGSKGGYNGLATLLTTPTTTTFTYALTIAQPNDATPSTGEVRQALRITGAVTPERATDLYTKQKTDEFWAFVILEQVSASKDRRGANDAISSAAVSGDKRQQILQPFIVIVYSKTSNDLTGRLARDDMESISSSMYSSLIGFKADSGLLTSNGTGVYFVNSGTIEYTTSFYSYGFRFQLLANIENEDTIAPDFNVAFRDIALTMTTDLGTGILTATIDLDDEPLP